MTSGTKPQLVIGRIVSMEKGRPTISVPVGSGRSQAETELLAAAENWKVQRNDPALRAQALSRLMTAAESL